MTLYELLETTGLPVAYGVFDEEQDPPYIAYIGSGQMDFAADDTYYHRKNRYQIEYYFKEKDEDKEAEIEQLLLDNGYPYQKSEDLYLDDQRLFLIYYQV